ncbi:MAG: amino acid adenylation domain-containing protein [Algicola sp.]|nr:amino acid adenylation domain-containing protein [Algicola sp.]
MNILTIMKTLKNEKVRLEVDGERLLCYMPDDNYRMPPALQLAIKGNKAELVEFLQTLKKPDSDHASVTSIERNQSGYLLSSQQERLWFVDQMQQGLDFTYNNAGTVHFDGQLDPQILISCFNAIVARHESLRTRFFSFEGKPLQAIDDQWTIEMPVIEIDSSQDIMMLAKEHAQHLFDLASGGLLKITLLKLSDIEHVLLLNIHHIISDGWSIKVLLEELLTLYQSNLDEKDLQKDALPVQYIDYAAWQQQSAQKGYFDRHLQYWQNQLKAIPAQLELSTDQTRPAVQDNKGNSVTFELPGSLVEELNNLSIQKGVSLFMTLLSGFNILLWRYTQQTDLLVGTPIANRKNTELEGLIGFFVNTLVLRTQIDSNDTVAILLDKIKATTLGAYEHQALPFEQLVSHLNPVRSLSHNPVFQVMFTLQNTQMGEVQIPQLQSRLTHTDNNSAKFDLSMELTETAKTLSGRLEYATSLFSQSTIDQIIGHYQIILQGMAQSPDLSIAQLPLLSAEQQVYLCDTLNDTQLEYPNNPQLKGLAIHQLFEHRAALNPDNAALLCPEQKTQLSYRVLNEKTNQLAHYLRKQGVKADTLVGLCIERSFDMVIGLLAILKAGGAYVPLDPDYPQNRLEHMINDSGICLLLSHKPLLGRIPHSVKVSGVILLDDTNTQKMLQSYPIDNLPTASAQSPSTQATSDLAYVIYTSGSTGLPKGVMIEHDALVNRIDWMQNEYSLSEDDVVLQKTPFSFDVSVWEFFWPLTVGAQLVMAKPLGHKDPAYLTDVIRQTGVTTLHFVPSMLRMMLTEKSWADCTTLQRVFCSGEALPADVVQSHYQVNRAPLHNLYGPTEAAIDVSYWACPANTPLSSVPIGKPIQNIQLYVLSELGQLQPCGVVGELHIAGTGLARGYLNQPALTAQKFIENPFSDDSQSRLYKTGDLVRYLQNGNLEYIGRVDTQVKIRGFRIELGEIEHQLSQHPQVGAAAVLARKDEPGQQRLVAYLCIKQQTLDSELSNTLRQYLQASLPDHMIPSFFMIVDQLPLTANGKLNKNALPAPDASKLLATYVAPVSEDEINLVQVWAKLLRLDADKLGVTANFFALGGDSILSIQVISRAAQLGLYFTVKQLFEYQTIQALAALVKSNVATQNLLVAPQEPVTGELTLLPIQHEFFTDEIDLHHFNQSVMLQTPVSFNPDWLPILVTQLYQRHDALRLRFDKSADHWTAQHQAFEPSMTAQSIEIVEVADWADLPTLVDTMQAGLSLHNGPLFRVVYFSTCSSSCYRNEGNTGRLLLIIHHLLVDGVSWRILLEDIEQLCGQLNQNKAPSLRQKTSSFQQWGAFLAQYASCDELLAERDYWINATTQVVPSLPQNALEDLVGVNTLSFELDRSTTSGLLQQAGQAYRSQINELLLAGLLLGFNQWSDNKAIRIDLEGHGREDLSESIDLSQTVGWFTSLYPLTLSADVMDIETVICAVKESYRAIPNRGIGYGILKYLAKDEALQSAPPAQILFNYLGQFDDTFNNDNYLKPATESTGQTVSSRRQPQHALSFNAMVKNGQLGFDLSFEGGQFSADSMVKLTGHIHDALCNVVAHCLEPNAGCLTPSDFPLAALSQTQLTQWLAEYQLEDIYPATPMQQGLLFHSAMDNDAYVTQLMLNLYDTKEGGLDCEGDLDSANYQMAWQQVVARHASLRTAFASDDSGVMQQLVFSSAQLPWHQQDLSELTPEQQNQTIESYRLEDKQQGFDTTEAPLMRFGLWSLGEGRWQVLWSHHHALIDGWCLPIILAQVNQTYQALQANMPLQLPLTKPYRDHVAWLQSRDIQTAQDFWQKQLSGIEAPTPLPTCGDQNQDFGLQANHLRFTADETAELEQLARQTQTTVNIILQGAWAYLLSKYSGESSVVFGSTVSGRPADLIGVEQMVGLFISTLPVRVDIPTDTGLTLWLQTLLQAQIARDEFSYLGLTDITAVSEMPAGTGLFDSLFVFENYPIEQALGNPIEQALGNQNSKGLTISDAKAFEGTNYGLTLTVSLSGVLDIKLESQKSAFNQQMPQQLLKHLHQVLKGMVSGPDSPVDSLALLTADEQHYLLNTLNDQQVEYAKTQCIHQLFEQQVAQHPDNIAVTFSSQQLSYRQLNEKANQLAYYLIDQGVKPDTLVGLCVKRSTDMIVAILAILKAGGAYVPLDPNYPNSRLTHMISDSGIKLLLCHESLQLSAGTCLDDEEFQQTLLAYPTHNLPDNAFHTPDNLAYVIYTSGSTGKPKGVMVEHHNVVRLLKATQREFNFAEQDVWTLFHSYAFDFSVWEIWGALAHGGRLVIVPSEIARAPDDFYQLLIAEKVTVLNQTPSAFGQLNAIDALHANQDQQPSLSLRVVVFGGEALDLAQLSGWVERHGDNIPQLVNMYGITETTVHVTYRRIRSADIVRNKGSLIGRPIGDLTLYLLDERLMPVPIGVCGEMFVGGQGVTRGYLNQPQLTASRFIDNPFANDKSPAERLYRTGDLARYQPDGEIEYLGRIDDQVKIRGFRIELGEIQQQLSQLPNVESSLILAQTSDLDDKVGQRYLVAYVVTKQEDGQLAANLRSGLQAILPNHMVPSFFVSVDGWPLTTNGKIDIKALPKVDRALSLDEYVAPQTGTQLKLAQIWAELLKLDVDSLSVNANFFECGGHSLLSVRLVGEVRAHLAVELAIRDVFDAPVLLQLAALIDANANNIIRPPVVAIKRDSNNLPASFAQQRLWFIDRMDGGSRQYNMPGALSFTGVLDETIVEQAFAQIIERHEPLRTVFCNRENGVRQIVRQGVAFKVSKIDLTGLATDAQEQAVKAATIADANAIFDLEQDLMLRITIVRLAGDIGSSGAKTEGVLLFNMHHIASDGWSMGLLIKEFSELYQSILSGITTTSLPLMPPLKLQYADYAQWQTQWLLTPVCQRQLNYWQNQLADLPQVHGLPLDRIRPKIQRFEGARVTVDVSGTTHVRLKQLALSQNATLFMVLQAAFALVLSRHVNSDDIVMGVPVANRLQKELESMIGFFVNTLVLRTDCAGNPAFVDYLARVKITHLDAQANQDVPFEQLVEHMKPQRSTAHSPLFQIVFSMDTNEQTTLELPQLTLNSLERASDKVVAKYELALCVIESESGLSLCFEYNTDLFNQSTITRLSGHLLNLLEGIVADPNNTIGQLPMLSEQEQQYLCHTLNDTRVDYLKGDPASDCIAQLFELQVEQTPENIAVVLLHQQLTYRALNEKANRLAHYLRSQGVKPETLVGVCVSRSLDLAVVLLAVVKAGGAYVPLDPSYPQNRLAYMINDSGISIILAQSEFKTRLQSAPVDIFCLDEPQLAHAIEAFDVTNPVKDEAQTANNLAYMIYTSGSTGQPKGVLNEHKALVNLCRWHVSEFGIGSGSRATFVSSIGFDAAVWEFWPTLTCGGTLVMVPDDIRQSSDLLTSLLAEHDISHCFLPTALLEMMAQDLLSNIPPSLKVIYAAGQQLSHLSWHDEDAPPIFNLYGPSEAGVATTFYQLPSGSKALPPIGRPISNVCIYLLSPAGALVPQGAIGELCIGGASVGRGYHNLAQLTAERFIQNPFKDDAEARFYKTGDLARYRPDGNLEFVGRIDDQVKIRGFRIELAEIEHQLSQLSAIKSAVVLAREDEPGHKQLVGYVVASGTDLDTQQVKVDLQASLPKFMIPTFLVVLDEMPLTPNGKVNKRVLPVPDQAKLAGEYSEPTTDTERQLVSIWAQLLKIDRNKISATACFFDLGGHSILVMRLLSTIKQSFTVDMILANIFEFSCLNDLGSFIDQCRNEQKLDKHSNDLYEDEVIQSLMAIDAVDEEEDMEEFEL